MQPFEKMAHAVEMPFKQFERFQVYKYGPRLGRKATVTLREKTTGDVIDLSIGIQRPGSEVVEVFKRRTRIFEENKPPNSEIPDVPTFRFFEKGGEKKVVRVEGKTEGKVVKIYQPVKREGIIRRISKKAERPEVIAKEEAVKTRRFYQFMDDLAEDVREMVGIKEKPKPQAKTKSTPVPKGIAGVGLIGSVAVANLVRGKPAPRAKPRQPTMITPAVSQPAILKELERQMNKPTFKAFIEPKPKVGGRARSREKVGVMPQSIPKVTVEPVPKPPTLTPAPPTPKPPQLPKISLPPMGFDLPFTPGGAGGGKRTKRGRKINPVIENPLDFVLGGLFGPPQKKGRRRKKKR